MRLFDTHAHLHFPELLADLDAVLDRARAAGVAAMVTVGTDRETNPAAVALAERLPGVFASVGIHPHDAGEATDADYAAMEELTRDSPKVVALGRWGSTSSATCPRPTFRCRRFAASSDWPGASASPWSCTSGTRTRRRSPSSPRSAWATSAV